MHLLKMELNVFSFNMLKFTFEIRYLKTFKIRYPMLQTFTLLVFMQIFFIYVARVNH